MRPDRRYRVVHSQKFAPASIWRQPYRCITRTVRYRRTAPGPCAASTSPGLDKNTGIVPFPVVAGALVFAIVVAALAVVLVIVLLRRRAELR
jgi:hypothetical protein